MSAVRVVKIGGAALTDGSWLTSFAEQAARAGEGLVIVHGGGPEISALSSALAIDVAWSNGRRVTSDAALDAASMVLSGRVNKRIVRVLLNAGVDAIGVSGEDGGLIRAEVAEGGALGRVGVVADVRTALLRSLLDAGLVPVISPISRGPDGAALNVNADEVAAAVAVAVGASELLFLTDVPGVRDAGGVCPVLGAEAAAELVASGVAHGGMKVKLEAALDALLRGVALTRIGDVGVLTDAAAGTRIMAEVAA